MNNVQKATNYRSFGAVKDQVTFEEASIEFHIHLTG
jgi:hypothetical protein